MNLSRRIKRTSTKNLRQFSTKQEVEGGPLEDREMISLISYVFRRTTFHQVETNIKFISTMKVALFLSLAVSAAAFSQVRYVVVQECDAVVLIENQFVEKIIFEDLDCTRTLVGKSRYDISNRLVVIFDGHTG
jgi:hypothetical protein